jgi:hypothetical protein
VYDDTGGFEAISVAEKLRAEGAEVTFVTRHETIGATVEFPPATVYSARERIEDAAFTFLPLSTLGEITARSTEVRSIGGAVRSVPADTVVIVGYNHANRENADALDGLGPPVHLVGDVTGSRTIQEAMRQAADVGGRL